MSRKWHRHRRRYKKTRNFDNSGRISCLKGKRKHDIYDDLGNVLINGIIIDSDIYDTNIPLEEVVTHDTINSNKNRNRPCNGSHRDIVNNLRHSHTSYETALKLINRFVDKKDRQNQIHDRIKNVILHKIGEARPELKEECDRQKMNVSMVRILKQIKDNTSNKEL